MAEDKHSGARHTLDKMGDAAGAAVGKAAAATAGSRSADSFVTNALQSDMFEIRSSELALRRSASPEVKALAQEMIDDHTKSSHRLESLIGSASDLPDAPTEIDKRRETLLDHLEKAPDEKFDRTYLDQQAAAHDEATTLFEGYAENGDHEALRSFAAETLPILRQHQAHVQNAKA